MKPNFTFSLDDLRKIVDSCFKDPLLIPALDHYDDGQISEFKDFILPNLVDYCQKFGEIHSLVPVSVYCHTLPVLSSEIHDISIVLFRVSRKSSCHCSRPMYFVVFLCDFKLYRSLNSSLSIASHLYSLYVDGMRIQSRDISPALPF